MYLSSCFLVHALIMADGDEDFVLGQPCGRETMRIHARNVPFEEQRVYFHSNNLFQIYKIKTKHKQNYKAKKILKTH